MVVYIDKMNYKNVVSKRYVTTPAHVQEIMIDFLTMLGDKNWKLNGMPFFAAEKMANSDFVVYWMFAPTDLTSIPEEKEIDYFSYFSLEHAICCRVKKDFEASEEKAMEAIRAFAQSKNFNLISPAYCMVNSDPEQPYAIYNVAFQEIDES